MIPTMKATRATTDGQAAPGRPVKATPLPLGHVGGSGKAGTQALGREWHSLLGDGQQ